MAWYDLAGKQHEWEFANYEARIIQYASLQCPMPGGHSMVRKPHV